MSMGGGGGSEIDVTDAVNQISEMVQAGLQFAEHQMQQGLRIGEQKVEQGIRFGEDQLDRGIDYAEPRAEQAIGELKTGIAMGKAELKEGFDRYQALNAPYRIMAYNALDGLMDSMGMARMNVSSADLANSLEQKAKSKGAQDQMRAAGIGLLSQLPAGLDADTRRKVQYAIMSGANPQAVSEQLSRVMAEQGLSFDTNRDRTATQFERFKLLGSGVQVPRVEGEGGDSGGGSSGATNSAGLGGAFGSAGVQAGLQGALNPTSDIPFNDPAYLNATQRSTIGTAGRNTNILNPLDSYLMNSLSAYQDMQRAQQNMSPTQSGLASALTNGLNSTQPRVVDIF